MSSLFESFNQSAKLGGVMAPAASGLCHASAGEAMPYIGQIMVFSGNFAPE